MTILAKSILGATAATALAVAAPAQARDHDNGIDAGDVIAGALIIGGIAAIASAASGNDDRYDRRHDPRYGDRSDRRYDPRYGDRYDRGYGNQSPRSAIQQCSAAAQREASRYGRAQVTEITDIDRERRGFEVEGRIVVEEQNYGYRGRNGRYNRNARYDRRGYSDYDRGRFSCRIRYGRIDRLRVRGLD